MKLTNKLGLPKALYDAVAADPYSSGDTWRSVTQLISPPKVVLLKKRHQDEIEEDCADRLFSLYGQIIHGVLERANTTDRVEERLFLEVQGKKVSGQFDTLHVEHGRLSDWKFSTVWKALGTPDEWVAQMNLLALLLHHHGVEVKEAEIILLMRDHSKMRAKRESTYPQLPVARINIPLWPLQSQQLYLEERVKLHLDAETNLPECSPTERWQKNSIYAVMKPNRKTAVKLYDAKEFAVEHVKLDPDNLFLVERPGESIRCNGYCSAAPFCDQFKMMTRRAP